MVSLLNNQVMERNTKKINDKKEEMLIKHLPHVRKIAKHYSYRLPVDDKDEVFSAASVGLVEAYNRYSYEMNTSFWTYAQNRVIGAIRDDLRKKDPLTRSQRKKVKTVNRAFVEHTQVFGEKPGEEELSQSSGLSLDEIRKAKALSHHVHFISYEEYESREDGSVSARICDADCIVPEQAMMEVERKSLLQFLVQELPEKERVVIDLLYYSGKTPKEISILLGVTEGRISQINKQAISRLRKKAKQN
jgi:RNA polymerase sigma factor FliA